MNNLFSDVTTMKCYTRCPFPLYEDSITKECVMNNCSNNQYADDISYRCLSDCPKHTFFNFTTRHCVVACMGETFANISSRECGT